MVLQFFVLDNNMKIEKNIPVKPAYVDYCFVEDTTRQSTLNLTKRLPRGMFSDNFALMERGDSFCIVTKTFAEQDIAQKRLSEAASYYHRKKDTSTQFVTRVVENGVRVWRIL